MESRFDIKFQDGIVVAELFGDDSYDAAHKFFSSLMPFCEQHNCFKVLGLHQRGPLKITEGHDIQDIFRELKITKKFKFAWVVVGLSLIHISEPTRPY